MIKQIRASYFYNFKNAQYCALSTDINEIPSYLNNGDQVYIIDTGKSFIYNETTGQLEEEPTIGMLSGGAQNQVLMKNSGENYDMSWTTLTDLSSVGFGIDANGILNVISTEI